MPNISKIPVKKKKSKSKKSTNLPTLTKKTKKVKSSPIDYYNCLLLKAQND
jgi:hypothetical protein